MPQLLKIENIYFYLNFGQHFVIVFTCIQAFISFSIYRTWLIQKEHLTKRAFQILLTVLTKLKERPSTSLHQLRCTHMVMKPALKS